MITGCVMRTRPDRAARASAHHRMRTRGRGGVWRTRWARLRHGQAATGRAHKGSKQPGRKLKFMAVFTSHASKIWATTQGARARRAKPNKPHISCRQRQRDLSLISDQHRKWMNNRGKVLLYYSSKPEVQQTSIRPYTLPPTNMFWASPCLY